MLIRDAEVGGRRVDVALEGDRIVALGEGLAPPRDAPVIDAAGGALLPGLHDHHLHLFALAAAQSSLACGPPEVASADQLAGALASAPGDGWIRGVGYHESVAGPLDRDALDRWVRDRPVRVQHRSGALWMLNSIALERAGLAASCGGVDGVECDAGGRPNGRLFRLDAWLRTRLGLGDREGREEPDLAPVGAVLASRGVTGGTDATPGNGPCELARFEAAALSGALPQRLVLMGGVELPAPRNARIARGAVKLLLDERALPDFDALVADIERARAVGRAVAIHCVTRSELVLAATALRAAGVRAGDRLEHASVAPPDAVALVAELALTVVTQPNFLRERGDAYADEVDARDRPWLYRGRGWLEASVPLGGGTDAPFGQPDPWHAMRAAIERTSAAGIAFGREEALSAEEALALFTTPADAPGGAPRRVTPGAVADLCLLDRPWADARGALSREHVRATIVGGALVFRADA